MRLADEGGIEALSMRKLAQELGVKAMSLYNHVADKDDLLNGIVDIVVGEIEVPLLDIEWKTHAYSTSSGRSVPTTAEMTGHDSSSHHGETQHITYHDQPSRCPS